MRQLSPQQVFELIEQSETKPVLIDVREDFENEICTIEGSINIPLQNIAEATAELDPQQEYAITACAVSAPA